MHVRMTALSRSKSGKLFARKSIPADVRDAYARLYGTRWEAQLRLPRETPKHEAKTKHGEWLAEVETRIAALRAVANGEGQPLTKLNAIALAGRWYRWFVGQHENDPGPAKRWRDMINFLVDRVLYPEAPQEYHENPQADPEWEWAKHPDVRARVRPRIAELARTASFLADAGIALNSEANVLFVDAVSDDKLYQALTLLERRAEGDYTPDTTPESFPEFLGTRVGAAQGLDCWQLFEAFVTAVQPAASTVNRWRAVLRDLQSAFPDKAATAITEAEARGWAAKLVTGKRSALTVREVWIPAARRVFSWGEKQKHIRKSPFADISVDVPKRARDRETKAFTAGETRVILLEALKYDKPGSAFERAKRWAMWLCAYSGARAGEITQLRGADVLKRGAFYVMRLTPDAGTVKTRQARVVPIHEHLIEQGFIEFVEGMGKGPLFYNEGRKAGRTADPLNPSRTPAMTARARLGEWVRTLGVDDPEVSPTHGWRHTFKQTAERAGIPEKIHDAITGHAATTEGRKYGAPTAEDMAEAMSKFPRYDIAETGQGKREATQGARQGAGKRRKR